jgi:hypothetical protein
MQKRALLLFYLHSLQASESCRNAVSPYKPKKVFVTAEDDVVYSIPVRKMC